MSFSAFFVVDDTSRGGENDVSELSGWEQVVLPFFHVGDGDVVSWGDNTAFVDSSVQVDDDLASSVVIDFFEFSDVTVLLHDSEELNDDLGAWSDQDLSLVSLFGVGDALKAIREG